ncbi:hypothetical protein KC614_01400 [candidate division WWE3 bacterium]|uniref:Uncharacterized protein n=1 Tax=candidate division WWE3 bacterium TaxID=2053526 RepID=A0A955LKG4_UNCKA|nr:hypothetical protein [candidate division WWE3 bacterium]
MSRQKPVSTSYDFKNVYKWVVVVIAALLASGLLLYTAFIIAQLTGKLSYTPPITPEPTQQPAYLKLPTPTSVPTLTQQQREELVGEIKSNYPETPEDVLKEIMGEVPTDEL